MSAVPKSKGSLESREPSSQGLDATVQALAIVGPREALPVHLTASTHVALLDTGMSQMPRVWADDDLLTADEAATYLRCKVKTLYNYKCNGRIKGINRGACKRGGLLFRKRDLDAFLYGRAGS